MYFKLGTWWDRTVECTTHVTPNSLSLWDRTPSGGDEAKSRKESSRVRVFTKLNLEDLLSPGAPPLTPFPKALSLITLDVWGPDEPAQKIGVLTIES